MSINTADYGPLNHTYVKRIQETLDKALQEYPRTLVLRVDLRLPDADYSLYHDDPTLITRFIVSLKAQLSADAKRDVKKDQRAYPCRVRYIWAREFGQSGKKHYHLVLLFNKDAYAYPGRYFEKEGAYSHNLSLMIMDAWRRVLGADSQQAYPLVHFPQGRRYHLNVNSPDFQSDYQTVINHIGYLAKRYSKDYSDGLRSFGCSQH